MGILDLENLSDAVFDAVGRKTDVHLLKILHTEIKPNRHEARIVVLCEHCIHVASSKLPIKLEQSINFLDITSVESSASSEVHFVTDTKRLSLSATDNDAYDIDELIYCFAVAYLRIFPAAFSAVISKMVLSPPSRLAELESRLSGIEAGTTGPCGGFTAAYRCACDYHGIQFIDEIAWDVDAIYSSHNSREFSINDFDHLDARTLLPLLTALEYNQWFTKLSIANMKLSPEMTNGLSQLLKTNATISELVLSNVGLKWDVVQRLSASVVANSHTALSSLDLSHNSIEDRGLICLLPAIQSLHSGLTKLNFCHTLITSRGVNRLMEIVQSKCETSNVLEILNLSENCLKGDDVTNLYNFLTKPNCLTRLNLAATECHLELLLTALSPGCIQSLVHLDVSWNFYGIKRPARDSPASATEFFSSAKALKTVDFSSNRLPPETLKSILAGLASNEVLDRVELNLSGNALGPAGCQVLENIVADIHCLASLDISDNGFDHTIAGLLLQIGKNRHIKKLRIGKNVNTVKPNKAGPQFTDALVQLLLDEHSGLEVLSVDDMRLRNELALLLNALACNKSLCELDISGNHAADSGARALSKLLQLNRKLSVVHWDRNNTTPQGFCDIAAAMQRNHTMTALITPVSDVATALRINHEKTEAAVLQIEAALRRNNMPQKLPADSIFRMQHSLFLSSSQQLLERRAHDLELMIGRLMKECLLSEEDQEEIGRGLGLIKDTTAARELMTDFCRLASSVDKDESILHRQLQTVADDLQEATNSQLQSLMSEMLQQAEFKCPTAFSPKIQDDVMNSIGTTLDVAQLTSSSLNCSILNAVSVISFNVASMLCERITEELLHGLTSCLQSLTESSSVKPGSLATPRRVSSVSEELPDLTADSLRRSVCMRRIRPRSTVEFTACEGLTLASDMKDSSTVDALPATDIDLPTTVESGYRKSSLPDSTQKPGKPPVPVFRKRTSTGNCLAADVTDSRITDVIDSSQRDSKSAPSDDRSPVESNGLAVDATTVSEAVSAEPQNVSSSSCRQHPTQTPSLLSAVLATSAASIAMITIQGPSSMQGSAARQRNDTSSAASAAFPLVDPDVPKLTHLSKARPKNPKQHAAKRLAVVSESLLIEDAVGHDDGLDSFFGSGKQPVGSVKRKKPVASPRRAVEVAVVGTNGKERDHDNTADTSQSSQEEPSKSVSSAAVKSRPPPPAPKPRKQTPAATASSDSATTSTAKTKTSSPSVSKSANVSPARFGQLASNRGSAVRHYLKQFSDAAEDDGKDRKDSTATEKENVVAGTDSRPASDSTYRRQLSVREKAAAFLAKDSVC